MNNIHNHIPSNNNSLYKYLYFRESDLMDFIKRTLKINNILFRKTRFY